MAGLLDQLLRWLTNPRYLVVEELLLCCLLVLAWFAPRVLLFPRIERAFALLARRPIASMAGLALGLIAVRLALLPLFPVPTPDFHDEFSYLLGADTFAHFRLTNPPHPLWPSFETIHVLSQPAYMSVYQPAQALVLAAGQWLGHPWIGALGAGAGMCAAFVWMLRGWMPPGWALLGGVLAATRLCLFNYWMNSYWGGALAALCGALVIGASGRLIHWRSGATRNAALWALGAVILANRRPYEGLVLCASVGVLLLVRAPVRKLIAPMLAVMIPVAAWMGYYNWRGTGDVLLMPYQHAIDTYKVAGFFVWQPIRQPPKYGNEQMRQYFVEWEIPIAKARRERFVYTNVANFASLWRFLLGPALSLPLLAAPWLWRDRRMRPLIWIGVAGAAAMAVEVWLLPHYASPHTPLLWVLLLQMLRHLWQWGPRGRAAVGAVIVTTLLMTAVPIAATALKIEQAPSLSGWWSIKLRWERDAFVRRLETIPGRHLVLVRYGGGHDVHREWVYNGADIDRQRIVWARELDVESNRRLREYYRDRQAWLLVDDGTARLAPYP